MPRISVSGASASPCAPRAAARSCGGSAGRPSSAPRTSGRRGAESCGRRRAGKGQLIELCQIETMAALLGEPYLEWTVNRRAPAPLGNRSRILAPQGTYPAAGADRWVAISVPDDASWRALAAAIGRPEL